MRAVRRASLAALLLLSRSPSAAQEEPFERWTNHTFHRDVVELASDGERLWAGTTGGVLVWDTRTLDYVLHTRTANGLASDLINDLAVDGATGDVWAATDRGLSRLPGGEPADRWAVFDTANSPLADERIQAVAATGGTTWIGTFDAGLYRLDAGLYRLDAGGWTHFDTGNSGLSDDFVTSVAVAPGGELWVGAWSEGLDRFDGETWTLFDPGNTRPEPGCAESCAAMLTCAPAELGLLSVFVHVLAIDPSSGTLWVRNEDDGFCGLNGVSRFDGAAWSTFTSQNSGLVSNFIDAAAIAPDGDVWLTSRNGTSRFDGFDFTAEPDLRASAVATVGDDVWLGTPEGLVRLRGGERRPVTPNGLADAGIRALALDPAAGSAWVGTRAGLQRLAGSLWEAFDPLGDGIPRAVGALLLAGDGDLWVGLEEGGGVARLDDGRWTRWSSDTSGLCCPNVTALAEDAAGRIWAGWRFGGLSVFDGGSWRSFSAAELGLPTLDVNAIAGAPEGAVWLGTSAGAVRFDGETSTVFSQDDGLPADTVLAVALHPDGGVWLGTPAGAARLDGGVVTVHPLSGARVNALVIDAEGRVWAGLQNRGAARFDGQAWTFFGFDDGMLSDRVLSAAAHPDGDVWLGTNSGISIYEADPDPADDCTPAESTLCLRDGRFRVEVKWRKPPDFPTFRDARVSELGTTDSGLFYFLDPTNLELLIKVLDGCALNGHYWVFSAAVTDVEQTVTVTDLATSTVWQARNPAGQPAPAITDTTAFATCP